MMATTPPALASPTLLSRRSSGRSSPRSPLTIDLSTIPALSQPAPPSNTLLITNLNSLAIFHPAALATIRQFITSLVPEELHSFSPLRSFRRIVCSFYSIDAAIKVRQELDGATLLGATSPVHAHKTEDQEGSPTEVTQEDQEIRARIYFGEPTPIDNTKHYLDKPDAGKLFFISPPPSPPVGWESTREGAPNAEAHASDLQSALEKLGSKFGDITADGDGAGQQPSELEVQTNNAVLGIGPDAAAARSAASKSGTRTRSSSQALIYDPSEHATASGQVRGLPAVMLEDTSNVEDDDDEESGVTLDRGKKITAHTARPPVELME